MDNEKVFAMPLSKVLPLLMAKAGRKGRTREEVLHLVSWLTGYDAAQILAALATPVSYGDFFRNAPAMHPLRNRITGSICGVKIAEIADPLMQDMRRLDKLVDDLAKGKPIERILPH